ncbi:MAG: 30S ribosomal protein S8, partial [Candidatus Wolfebacteria bacterium]|nr:30S ribosomal protein S8 [Candidatus Wolfebacteria bacterium]
GYGTLGVSTAKGIMTGESARREKIGGELLFEIW